MAKYDNLTALLSRLGEENLSIERAALVKFGAILLAKPDAKSSLPPRGFSPVIHSALKSHTNIFDPEQILEREAGEDEEARGTKYAFFVKGSFYHYTVKLPEAKQKYHDMDTEQQFSVLSNGSLFAAYVEVEDVPIWSGIGNEFRELAKTQIEKETSLKCPTIGPCPIHPRIVIVVCTGSETEDAPLVKKYQVDEDIFIVTTDKRPTAELVLDCFFDFEIVLELFYDLALSRNDLLDARRELGRSFNKASDSVDELLKTPSWKIWKTHVLSRQSQIHVAAVHQNLVILESQLLDYDRDRNESLDGLKKDQDGALLSEFFRGHTTPDISLPSSITSALSFFEGQLQLYGNVRSLLFASVLGAVIGSVLTGVLVHFLKS